jgi:cell division septum initiation protein DivIVA
VLKIRKSIMAPAVILALVLVLSTAVAAFADNSGQGSSPASGFQDRGQNMYVQDLATASGQTTDQIQSDMTSGSLTVAQLAEQLAQAGTITESSLYNAILQATESNDQTRATTEAQDLISGQTPGRQGNSGQQNQSGSAQPSGQNWQNGMQDPLIQALATASSQTTDQIQSDMTSGSLTVAQLAEQLAQAGTITESSLYNAILQATESNDQTRATAEAQDLISGQMPSRPDGASSSSSSTTGSGNGIVLTIGSSRMTVNGTAQDIDPGYSTQPVIKSGRTFIPIMAIIKALGGTVSWSPANQQVTITLNSTTMVFTIGNTSATVNSTATTLTDAPYISVTGRTMLPLRFIMEHLGGHTVNWDSAHQTITIQ